MGRVTPRERGLDAGQALDRLLSPPLEDDPELVVDLRLIAQPLPHSPTR
jgi:hypothetical protein